MVLQFYLKSSQHTVSSYIKTKSSFSKALCLFYISGHLIGLDGVRGLPIQLLQVGRFCHIVLKINFNMDHTCLLLSVKDTSFYFLDFLNMYVQSWTFSIIRLLNKPYENGVILTR